MCRLAVFLKCIFWIKVRVTFEAFLLCRRRFESIDLWLSIFITACHLVGIPLGSQAFELLTYVSID